ncbi:MAG: 23S rRNA (uracil(1939)-C(5))-methyltransferase RlmD [Desulfobacteraceae bacterium 4572_35.2]|nr:MAG: 23S rRNA (uracil(1939)-C(5))-methyltransferase RlmD [Desulfobacteraceae bacterium 4572_35.2]
MSVVVDITTLTNGGDGLGRLDGKAVFVSGAIPGDQVRCQLTVEKKRYAKGRLLEVVQSSPMRVEPQCQHFSECGGCDWQQLSYEDQCGWKERLFRDNCQHQLNVDHAVIKSLVKSPQQMGYRSRVQFKCGMGTAGFLLGFYQRASHSVVNVDCCPVVDPRIELLIEPLRQLFDASPYARHVIQIDVAVGDVGTPRIVIHFKGNKLDSFTLWLRQDAGHIEGSLFVLDERSQQLQHIRGEVGVSIKFGTPAITLTYGVGGFAQINLEQNRRLVEMVVREARLCDGDTVLDLYCGMGNFSLPVARQVGQVIGVEGYEPSIVSAKKNASAAGCENVMFHSCRVERFMELMTERVDVVILDPPRAGAKEALAPLIKLKPRSIIYVSCDQQTLLRDLAVLIAGGYQLESIQPIDMFPQTAHTEVLAVLR